MIKRAQAEPVGGQILVMLANGWLSWREIEAKDVETKYRKGVGVRYIYTVVSPSRQSLLKGGWPKYLSLYSGVGGCVGYSKIDLDGYVMLVSAAHEIKGEA